MKEIKHIPLLTVIGFAAMGLFSFGLTVVVLLVRPEGLTGDPVRGSVLALTHLTTLGWIGSLLFAAAYVVGPKLSGSPLWSSWLAAFHLLAHFIGMVLLIGGLAVLRYDIAGVGSIIIFCGLIALILNLMVTASRRAVWSPANVAFQTGLFWLAITAGIALWMLRGRTGGAIPFSPDVLIALHAHFALLGFLAQVLLGVSSYLIPLAVGRSQESMGSQSWAWSGWILLNGGLLFLIPAHMLAWVTPLLVVGALIFLGILGFVLQIFIDIWKERKLLTWPAITHLTGIVLLAVLMGGALLRLPDVATGAMEASREWMRFYISMALLGPFSLAIIGTGGRVIPRLVWTLRFGPWRDRWQVPSPGSLSRHRASAPAYFALVIGLLYIGIGQWWEEIEAIRLGAILMLIGFAWFLFSVAPAIRRLAVGVTPEDIGNLSTSHQTNPHGNSNL